MASEQRTIEQDRTQTLEILRELRAELNRHTGQQFEVTPIIGTALRRFWRCVRLYDATALLLREQLPEEAAVLTRPLFEEALRLCEMEEKVELRPGFALRHKVDGLTDMTSLFFKGMKHREQPEKADLEARLADEKRQIARFQQKHGITKVPKFLDPLAAAARYCEPNEYWFYEYTHKYVHGSDVSLAHTTQKVEGRPDINVHDRSNDLRLCVILATFASRSLVLAGEAIFKMMGWADRERLAEIQDKLQPIIDRVQERHGS